MEDEMAINVLEFLEATARRSPDKTACADEHEEYSYSELEARARRIGTALTGRTQVRMPVPVFMDKGCEALSVFMGTVYAGCFYVMLDPSQPPARIDTILDTLKPQVIVTDEKTRAKLDKLQYTGEVLDVAELAECNADDEKLAAVRAQALDVDPLYSIFTSGSTGVPKGVIVSHRSVIDFIKYFTEIFNITSDDVMGNQAPFDFDVSVKDIY